MPAAMASSNFAGTGGSGLRARGGSTTGAVSLTGSTAVGLGGRGDGLTLSALIFSKSVTFFAAGGVGGGVTGGVTATGGGGATMAGAGDVMGAGGVTAWVLSGAGGFVKPIVPTS